MSGFKQKRTGFQKRSKIQESWMFNGAGDPVFMGSPGNVSQFGVGGSTSPGAPYLPDEVARMLVKESGLRKQDTCPKRVIVGFLESMGLSAGLAVDVAKVLRDVYGITPTFEESTLYARSGALIDELTAVSEGFELAPMQEAELTEADLIGQVIQREFMESTDPMYDVTLAHLAMLPAHELRQVMDFFEWVGPEVFDRIEMLVVEGRDDLADHMINGLCWPSRIQFMSEEVQSLFDEDADSVIKDFHAKRAMNAALAAGKNSPKHKEMLRQKQLAKPISDKKRMKIAAKGNSDVQKSDPLARKAKAQAANPLSGAVKSDPAIDSKLAAFKKTKGIGGLLRKKVKPEKSGIQKLGDSEKAMKAGTPEKTAAEPEKDKVAADASPSRMKRAGGAAVGFLKKAWSKVKEVGKGIIGGTADVAGHAIGTGVSAYQAHREKTAQQRASWDSSSHDGSSRSKKGKKKNQQQDMAPQKPKGPGLAGHIGGAIGRFVKGFKRATATPGIDHEKAKADAEKPDAEKVKKERVDKSAATAESVLRSGSLLAEVAGVFRGEVVESCGCGKKKKCDCAAEKSTSPADVVAQFESVTVADEAILEAIAELEWTDVANIAGFMVLKPSRFHTLIESYKLDTDTFRSDWVEFVESGEKPSWMNLGSFISLTKLSLDEGVIPRLVYWAAMALREADQRVVSHVVESYPELGKSVYGPAGSPTEGPRLAKAYMTPHPAGAMKPSNGDATTRMFSDPEDRAKKRKTKLADVMKALDGMRKQADSAGVDPEGMFLNLYRDMHREKVRYS